MDFINNTSHLSLSLSPKEKELVDLCTDVYLYGYPLVTMELSRRMMTNVNETTRRGAPMGQFMHARAYPEPGDREVTAPNADTLYSLAWLDLSVEPYIFKIPDAGDRYYMIPMLDGWTDVFAVPGERTTGSQPQTYLLVGPGWEGIEPQEGIDLLRSPTSIVWLLVRTYCSGTKDDYAKVHTFQDSLTITPLSAYGATFTPSSGSRDPIIDTRTPVREQVNNLSLDAFFDILAPLLKDNPPAEADTAMVAKMEQLGIVPGQPFNQNGLPIAVVANANIIPKIAQQILLDSFKEAGGIDSNGWNYFTNLGVYGTDYLLRALTTMIGLGANRPQDAIYPLSHKDADGNFYDGAHDYVMHFDKDALPPVLGFWSITLYDAQYSFVKNPLNRYKLGSRDELAHNPDGSVDLYMQKESPGPEKESNWLSTPPGKFILMLRLYWPTTRPPSIIDGSWTPPAVRKKT